MKRCPSALQEEDNDNAQFLLDNLDPVTFEHISEYLLINLAWSVK